MRRCFVALSSITILSFGCSQDAVDEATGASLDQAGAMYEVYDGIFKPTDGPPTVTLSQFDSVQDKSTYEQAVAVIGVEADVISDEQVGDFAFQRKAKWINGDGSEMELTFSNLRLIAKRQSGLK